MLGWQPYQDGKFRDVIGKELDASKVANFAERAWAIIRSIALVVALTSLTRLLGVQFITLSGAAAAQYEATAQLPRRWREHGFAL